MRLLVSVRSAGEARVAIAGGADIVDAKEPDHGALGAVSLRDLREIREAAAGLRPLSAAIGDVCDAARTAEAARACASAGVAFAKLGFITRAHMRELLTVAVQAATDATGIVAVLYADRAAAESLDADVAVAASCGAAGVLIDTADKQGPGLCQLIDRRSLARHVTAAHDRGLFIALAGKLSAEDLPSILETGVDIAGVRGAACDDGRRGRISKEKVALLAALVRGEQAVDVAGRDACRGYAGSERT